MRRTLAVVVCAALALTGCKAKEAMDKASIQQDLEKRGTVDLMKEEMDMLGAVRLREVEKAQHEIVAIARKLEEEGVITLGAGAGEAYVS